MKTKKESYISSFSLKLYNICQRVPFVRYLKIVLFLLDGLMLLVIKKPKNHFSNKKQLFVMYNYSFVYELIWLNEARELRKIYPSSHYKITLICQKGLNQFYESENVFDNVVGMDLTGSTCNLKKRFLLFKFLRKEYYDIVIDQIGVYECTTNVFMSMALVAGEKITILDTTLKGRMCPRWISNLIYTKIIEIDRHGLSLLEFYAEMIRGLGEKEYKVGLFGNRGTNIKFAIPDKYFIVFPSASTTLKRWPIANYVLLTELVYNKLQIPLLICGTDSDLASLDEFRKMLKDIPYVNVVSKTNLLEFIELVKSASFIVTNDTSTYHIAAINQTPVAIITGGYTYDRYVSYKFEEMNRYRRPCIIVKNKKCFNCDNRCKRLSKDDELWPCLSEITVPYAWKKIES